jgi:MFS family permease
MVGTLPGRTQGLGLITEPLLRDFQIDRVTYAGLNFWATIVGTTGAIGIGQLLDRFGSRLVLTVVSIAVGAAVAVTGVSTSLAMLALGITLTRLFGQSALSVVSLAIVGHWFVRRIDYAMAVYSVVMSIGFMIAFPLVGTAVQQWGWRAAWLALAGVLAAGLAPLGWAIVRRNPESVGLRADGDWPGEGGQGLPSHGDRTETPVALDGVSWGAALRTPTFWVFAFGAALYGLVASGIGLFNESILSERGFGPQVYYQTLVVTAMTALAGNFGGGWLATRMPPARLLAASLLILAAGLAALPHVTTLAEVMLWATAMGIGGGTVMVLFFSIWPRAFGRRHLGRVQGSAQAVTVLASAIGPLLLAWCVEWTGSYTVMFRILAAVIALAGASALLVRVPQAPATRVVIERQPPIRSTGA